MQGEEYRITARIKRADGTEKTVTFRGNPANMEEKLIKLFHATAYKPYRIEETKFSSSTEWRKLL